MKHNNKKRHIDDYEDEIPGPRKSIREEKRRPIRNLKHAWQSHETDFEEYDDFYER